jgi:4-hydroxy-4-methyl-2-oxoglutarate aldolase
MATRPATITRRADFERASPADLETLRRFPSCVVGDALGRRAGLGPAVRALTVARCFAGSALTVRCGAGDNLAALVALASTRPGDVLVIACDAADDAAIVGGIYAKLAAQRGACAIVTDGLARDVHEMESAGIPVFAAGVHANGPFKAGPGDIGQPIAVAGVRIEPGDIVVGDDDGIVVVPRARAAETIARAREIGLGEQRTNAAFARGETPDWLARLIADTPVRDLDAS